MPPRLHLRSLAQLADFQLQRAGSKCIRCQYATVATTVPAPVPEQMTSSMPALPPWDPRQPPSHRDPTYWKSQVLRSYVSLLKTTPLIVLFQHNNIKALEWSALRRELECALKKVDDQLIASAEPGSTPHLIADAIELQVIKTTMFEQALRVAEYYTPGLQDPSQVTTGLGDIKNHPSLTHSLSKKAYRNAQRHKNKHPLTPLLHGSICLVTFPTVSPQHLKTVLSILSPSPPNFPAPSRRANPTYHEPAVQDGIKKLMLLGTRVDGQVFDMQGTRWVGSIDGGIDGLRAQVVALLQGFGAGLTRTLDMAGQNVWFTMESRRRDMEEKEKLIQEEKRD